MSKWAKIIQDGLFPRIASECYNKRFPVNIRARLANWLEVQEPWILSMDPCNPSNQAGIYQFLQGMLFEVEQMSFNLPPVEMNSQDSILNQHILETTYKQCLVTLRTNASHFPYELFNDIKESLMEENKLLSQFMNLSTAYRSNFSGETKAILSEKEQFKLVDQEICRKLTQVAGSFQGMEVEFNNISIQYRTLQDAAVANQDASLSSPHVQISLQRIQTALHNLCQYMLKLFNPTIKDIFVQAQIELQNFQAEQLRVSAGKKQIWDLTKIDGWFTRIAECLNFLTHFLIDVAYHCQLLNSDQYQNVTTLQKEIEKMKEDMIGFSFIIENQPKQVIRNNTAFGHPVKLRLLKVSSNMSTRPGNLTLLNEKMRRDPAYKPKETIGSVEFKKTSPPIITSNTIEYKNLKVTGMGRSSELERGKNLVVEEKFFIQFHCRVNVDGKTYELSTVSLPLSITSHPNQEDSAWATILWGNALDTMRNQGNAVPVEPGLNPLSVNVTWSALIEWIDYTFQKLGKGLTDRNKNYLKGKLFRGSVPSHEMVSWQLFAKDTLVEVIPKLLDNWKEKEGNQKHAKAATTATETLLVPFTFWEWLWACLDLLNWKPKDLRYADKSLQLLWEQNKIEGFMTEDDIKQLLTNALNAGTFIIRFPEGRPKSIGLYVFDANDILRKFTYTSRDLDKQPLHDIIMLNPLLNYLYPNIEKREAFRKPLNREIINGYVLPQFRQYIPSAFLQATPGQNSEQYVPSPASSGHSFNTQSTQSPSSTKEHSSTTSFGRRESITSHSDYSATEHPSQPETESEFSALLNQLDFNAGFYNTATASEVMSWRDEVEASLYSGILEL